MTQKDWITRLCLCGHGRDSHHLLSGSCGEVACYCIGFTTTGEQRATPPPRAHEDGLFEVTTSQTGEESTNLSTPPHESLVVTSQTEGTVHMRLIPLTKSKDPYSRSQLEALNAEITELRELNKKYQDTLAEQEATITRQRGEYDSMVAYWHGQDVGVLRETLIRTHDALATTTSREYGYREEVVRLREENTRLKAALEDVTQKRDEATAGWKDAATKANRRLFAIQETLLDLTASARKPRVSPAVENLRSCLARDGIAPYSKEGETQSSEQPQTTTGGPR